MSKKPKAPLMLAPECQLGQMALDYRSRIIGKAAPTYMRLTGDGCVAFGWREDLPAGTQQSHFCDRFGNYDCGEVKVAIIAIVEAMA